MNGWLVDWLFGYWLGGLGGQCPANDICGWSDVWTVERQGVKAYYSRSVIKKLQLQCEAQVYHMFQTCMAMCFACISLVYHMCFSCACVCVHVLLVLMLQFYVKQ